MLRAPSDSPAPWRNPVWLLFIGLGGFTIGIGLLWLGWDQTARSEEFVRTTGFAVWAALIGVQTAYWAVVAGPLWVELAAMWREAKAGHSAILTLAGALVIILIVFPLLSAAASVAWPLWGHTMKTRALTIIGGLVVGVPALSGIALVQRRLSRREAEPGKDDLPVAIRSRSQILRFLSVAGAVIGLAVLAAGALRKAAVPEFVVDREFPQEGILLYGAFFTGLLLLVYVPAHLALRRLGLRIRDHYFPLSEMPAPDSDFFKGWLDKRTALETLLQLNVTPSQQLQASLFILAPLISAVITSLVPKST
jgi:uncharacterized membrane protein YagU involved in acid resistance